MQSLCRSICLFLAILFILLLSVLVSVQPNIVERLRNELNLRLAFATNYQHISDVALAYQSQSNHAEECKYFQQLPMTCNMTLVTEKIHRILGQGGCLRPTYSTTKTILFHMYLTGIRWTEEGYYLSMKAYLITQDLRRTQLIIWTDNSTMKLLANNQFFKKCHPYIQVQVFDYEYEIRNTPLEKHSFFHSGGSLLRVLGASTFSDIVRNLLLHNYGHVWLDNDALPLRDLLSITTGIGYQFIPAFTHHSNGHILFLYPHSKLSVRILRNLVQFSMKFDPEKKQHVPDQWPMQPRTGLISWAFNDALPLLTKTQEQSNITEDDNRQFWYDIGWFDPLWKTCLSKNYDLSAVYDNKFTKQLIEDLSCNPFFVLHTRYPRTKPSTFNNSFMHYLIQHIDTFFTEDNRTLGYKLQPMDLLTCARNR